MDREHPPTNPPTHPRERVVFRAMDMGADLKRLAHLSTEVDAIDQTNLTKSAAEIQDELDRRGSDGAQDTWLAVAPSNPDRLLGAGFSFRVLRSPNVIVSLMVHPAWRRQGIGSALLAHVLDRARALGVQCVLSDADSRLPGSSIFLTHHGFAWEQVSVQMRTAPDSLVAEPLLPAGYTIQPYPEVGDVEMLTRAINRGFTGHWENREREVDEIGRWLAGAQTRPAGIFLAFRSEGDLAGVCWTSYNTDANARCGRTVGHIDRLGIVPEHRRHGLGRALLLTGMRWLRTQGQAILDLDVIGDNEHAQALYASVGFAPTKQTIIYRREL